MKLNGDINIITDNDIVTTGKHIGSNLNTVIEEIEGDITQLKGNMKFIYANGSVGGGGGGGSSTTKWSIVATLGGKTIESGNVISLSSDITTYPLSISISGGSASYNVTYSYGGSSRSAILNSENNWRFTTNIELITNGTISIEATDNILIKTAYADYITIPYSISDLTLIRSNGSQYASTDIYIESAVEEGLYMHTHYTISVNAEAKYQWVFDNVRYEEVLITDKDGDLNFAIPEEYLRPEMANAYNGQLIFTITPENQEQEVIVKNVSFNLIPNTIYLKILPEVGTIYDTTSVLNPYQYGTNREIAIDCRIYKGANQMRDGTLDIITDESSQLGISIKEGETIAIKVSFINAGWHPIRFVYSLGGDTGETTKYLNCLQVSSLYNWFKSTSPSSENYYRGWDTNPVSGISNVSERYIQMHTSDLAKSCNFSYYTEGCNLLINIGIQYNEINDDTEPICTLYNFSDSPFVTIYQNKAVFEGVYSSPQECPLFLHKESNYAVGNPDNYHLITISLASVWRDYVNQIDYNECVIYLDGKLEGAANSFTGATAIIKSISLFPGNYSINHLDVSYFAPDVYYNRVLFDSDINYYYNTYISKSAGAQIDDEETAILNFLYDTTTNKVNYSIENDLIKVDNTLYDNVAQHCEIPTLVIRVNRYMDEYSDYDVLQWLNTGYGDSSSSSTIAKAKVTVTSLRWGKNKSTTQEIRVPSSLGSNTRFYIQLQGSSTMGYKSKNLTLGLKPGSDLDPSEFPIFSPNYKAADSSTFLHETSFTLKADVVDSSHTNNVAMGRFINDNNKFDYSIGQSGANPEIVSHVRQCLDGFPTLVYLETNNNGVIDTYYLGVYSFNLGRDSYFNLGYSDLSQLDPNYLADTTDTTFSFTLVGGGNTRGINPVDGFVAAEVQDNSKFWDFSQYHESVLFQQGDENGNFMFGDIKTSAGDTGYFTAIKNFVKSIAAGGGYLFHTIHKLLEPVHDYLDDNDQVVPWHTNDDEIAYHTIDVVPDYQLQYVRTNNTTYTPIHGDLPAEGDLRQGNLEECIGSTDPESTIVPKLNYNSLAYYYTTCMAFGLVDSVQKNMTIKKWNGPFGLFFYDMDTCLGRDNDGNKSSYFCFSDYWKSDIKEYDENGNLIDRTIDPTTPAARTVNNGCTILRDYFPSGSNIVGYDIPSSYLFAIAKYTKCLTDFAESVDYLSPQTIYANWRTSDGVLANADTFVSRYFASNLSKVPPCLLNLNYRNKYLYNKSGTAFDSVSNNLHGTGVEEVRDWMNGRMHILDAYFNLSSEDVIIYDPYKEPKPILVDASNKDIYIISDIFCSDNDTRGINRIGPMSFNLSAPDYSPLIVRKATSIDRYLLEKQNIDYEINTVVSGNQVTRFGGSQLWTKLKNVNSFISSLASPDTFTFRSKWIDMLNGDVGTITTNWNLESPSVKEIHLNSPSYAGSLSIDSSFYNLNRLDISRSRISLSINGSDVSEINASNLNGASTLEIRNCSKLTSVNLSNANVTNCTLSPIWTSSINLSNNRIQNLTVDGNSALLAGTLTVTNNAALKRLTFSKFENVVLHNNTALTSLTCNDTDRTMLHTLSVTDCKNLTSVEVWVDGLTSLNLSGCTNLTTLKLKGSNFSTLKYLNLYNTNVATIIFDSGNDSTCLDLSRFTNLGRNSSSSVTYIRLGYNPAVEEIQFANDSSSPVYLNYNLQGCTNLRRVYGNIIINVTSCFYDLKNFSIHGSDLSTVRWKGLSVLNGTKVKHPLDITGLSAPTTASYRQEGSKVTNLTFGTSAASYAFRNTKCTLFDYYYILSNLGSATDLSGMFEYANNEDYGIFDIETDNNPDKRLFKWATAATSVYFCFAARNYSHKIYLESPTISNGVVTNDNGLFSPLKNVTNFGGVFYSYTYACDQYLFARLSDNYSAVTINYFTPIYVLNEPPSDYSWSTILNIILHKDTMTGNLEHFFDKLPNLANSGDGTSNDGIAGMFNGVDFIDFNHIFKIPAGIKSIRSAFVPTYAKCTEFELKNYFMNPANVKYIWQSFKMNSSPSATYNVTMPINETTFAQFTNIVEIGYGGSGDHSSNSWTASSFSGFNKVITSNDFPYGIFDSNTKLTKVAALFANATSANTLSNVKLPGRMFKNTPQLRDISGLFYNMDIDYQLSNGWSSGSLDPNVNFYNCTNLDKLDYTFAQDYTNNGKYPHLTGQIPYRFLYHGGSKGDVVYYGTNTQPTWDDETETWHYENTEHYTQHDRETVNSTISSMQYCFQHSSLSAFVNQNPEILGNPEFEPHMYKINESTGLFTVVTPNPEEKTIIWGFDGINYPSGYNPITFQCLDDSVLYDGTQNAEIGNFGVIIQGEGGSGEPSGARTYLAPPDLLRYCTSNCNITGLFAYSGLQGWSITYNGTNNTYNMFGYGITGRICPYMLKPVYNTASVENLFRCCKKLAYYKYYTGTILDKTVMIPEDFFTYAPNIIRLGSMFEDTLQPQKSELSYTFKPLLYELNIGRLFYLSYWDSSLTTGSTDLQDAFTTNDISNTGKAFCITTSQSTDRVVNQKITFSNMYKSKYNSALYEKAEFSDVFRGYTKMGDGDSNDRFGVKTLYDSIVTKNYQTYEEL